MDRIEADDALISIAPATRAGAHLLISLYGPPESGKTMTALKLARGLAGKGKIGFLDTESGRGRLYSDAIPGGYEIGELSPPFTAERYVSAIHQFERAGYPVLIVDSFSHVWAGEGGILEQADKSGAKGLQKWLQPKLRYKKLMNCLLATKMHIIFCSRAKQPIEEYTDDQGKKQYRLLDWIEVQDKNLRYEMTVVLEMRGRGAFQIRKCPGPLQTVFAGHDLIDESAGASIAQWVAGGDPINPAYEALRIAATDAAEKGGASLDAYLKTLDRSAKALLAPIGANLRSIATTADDEIRREREELGAQEGLDDPFADPEPIEIGEADRSPI